MKDEMSKELAKMQEKTRAINSLANCIHTASKEDAREIAYLIHRIIEQDITLDMRREVISWQLKSKGDIFIKV